MSSIQHKLTINLFIEYQLNDILFTRGTLFHLLHHIQ